MVIKDFWQELEDYNAFIQEYIGRKLDTYVNLITHNEIFANEGQLMNVLPPVASFYDIPASEDEIEKQQAL